jgi:ubiquinone/menaquinone biosynthesis C-methylase UbiE
MDNQLDNNDVVIETGNYVSSSRTPAVFEVNRNLEVPKYLDETYWWAYLHPKGVNFFDKPLIVNGILFGNYRRLRDQVVDTISKTPGNVLQIAAVYGNITPTIAKAIGPNYQMDVVDVAPIQLQNLSTKLSGLNNVYLHHQDASELEMERTDYEHVVLFFILHEVPDFLKSAILEQAFRHCRPGGKVTIVDYHQPKGYTPQRYFMYPVLSTLEPFALSMWHNSVETWLPKDIEFQSIEKETYFGGLYQKVEIIR